MKTKVKNKNSFTAILSVEIPWNDLKADYEIAFNSKKSTTTPPGGRKGKFYPNTPEMAWFVKNFTPVIEADFAQNSINKYFQQSLEQEKLTPINQGKILDMKFKSGEDLKFDIEFEIKPEFKLPNYEKKFKVTAVKYISSDQDLTDTLKDLQNRFSEMKEIKTGAKPEHFLFVDLQELEDGAPVIGKKIEKQYIRLGFGAFKDGALDLLNGIKKNEKRNVSIDVQGKNMNYEVFVHKVEEQIIPELDDKFAKKVDPTVKNIAELKKTISNNIVKNFENEHLKSINNAIIDYFIQKTKIEPPDSMVENYLDHLVENNKAQQPNLTEDQEKQIRSDELNNAIFNIKWYLIKEKIIHDKKINVSKDDFENRKNELIEKEPDNATNIKKFLKIPENQQRFFDDLLSEKLFTHLREFSNVKVNEKKSDELRKEQGISS